MKPITNYLAGAIAVITGLLVTPGIHDFIVGLASKNPYLAILVPALLSIAALYHNPKAA